MLVIGTGTGYSCQVFKTFKKDYSFTGCDHSLLVSVMHLHSAASPSMARPSPAGWSAQARYLQRSY